MSERPSKCPFAGKGIIDDQLSKWWPTRINVQILNRDAKELSPWVRPLTTPTSSRS